MVCAGHCTGQVPPVFIAGLSRSPLRVMAFRLSMLAAQLKYLADVYSVILVREGKLSLHL